MANCVNKSLPEFKKLAEEAGINPLVLAARVSVWQDKNGLDKWPNLEQLTGQKIKDEVEVAVSEPLNVKVTEFLDSFGFTIEQVEGNDYVAKVRFIDRVVEVVMGRATIDTLPEESSHVFVRMVKHKNIGLFNRFLEQIKEKPVYKEVFDEYKTVYTLADGKPDLDKIKEEAAGKEIARNIVRLYTLSEELQEQKSLLDRILEYIKNAIKRGLSLIGMSSFSPIMMQLEGKNVTIYEQAAKNILNNQAEGLQLKEEDYELLQKSPTKRVEQRKVVDTIKTAQSRYTEESEYKGEPRHFYNFDGKTDILGTASWLATQDSRNRNKFQSFTDVKSKALWDKIAQRGGKIHGWIEDMIKNMIAGTPSSPTSLYKSLSTKESLIYDKLQYQIQQLINGIKKEDPGAVFMPEVIIHDPNFRYKDDFQNAKKGVAGKIDLLVVHSDGTASIYDWKTTSKGRGLEAISIWKNYEYNKQVAIYKQILLNGNPLTGVPAVNGIRKSRLVQINAASDMNTGEIRMAQLTEQVPVAGEETGDAPLDIKLNSLYAKYNSLITRKPPKDVIERDLFYRRLKNLQTNIVNLHLRTAYKNIIENSMVDLKFVEGVLNKEAISLEDLRESKEISETYNDILSYIDTSSLDRETAERLEKVQTRANKLLRNIKSSQQSLIQEDATEYGIEDINLISGRVGSVERYFRNISGINHPLIAYLHNMTQESLRKTELSANTLRKEITQQLDSLHSWASGMGISLQDAYDLLVDKKRGTFASPVKGEFYDAKEKAIKNNDLQWLRDNLTINKENFKRQLEFFTNRVNKIVYDKSDSNKNAQRRKEVIQEWINYQTNLVTSDFSIVKKEKERIWLTDNWNKLNSEQYKPLREFYDFFTSKLREFSYAIPSFPYKNNFLPNITKLWLEELHEMNATGAKYLFQRLKKFTGVTDIQGGSGIIKQEGSGFFGKYIVGGEVPLYFINPIDPQMKSYDLGRTLQIFGEMAHNYINMSEIEAASTTAFDILKTQTAYENKVNPMTGEREATPEANKGWEEMYRTFMNFYVYGVSTENPSKFTKFLDTLNKYTSFKLLGLSIFPALAAISANINNTITQVSRGDYYTATQYSKSMAMLVGGKIHKTEGNQVAYHLISAFSPQFDNEAPIKNRKLSSRLFKTSVLNPKRYFTVDTFFRLLKDPDQLTQAASFLSLLQNAYITKEGEIVLKSNYRRSLRTEEANKRGFDNFYEIKDKTIRKEVDDYVEEVLKKEKTFMDKASVKDGKLIIEGHEELTMESMLAFRQMARQLSKRVIGTMDSNDIAAYKTNALIRTLMLFRNWAPGLIEERWSELRYNRELQKAEWGKYKTFFNYVTVHMEEESNKLRWTLLVGYEEAARIEYAKRAAEKHSMGQDMDITLDEFVDLYKSNMKAAWTGIGLTIAVIALIFTILSSPDDDDEDASKSPSKLMQFTKRVVKRSLSELTMFVNPIEALNILKSPSAATAPLVSVQRLFRSLRLEFTGILLDDEEMRKKATPLKEFLDFSPVVNIEKLYRFFDQDWERYLNNIENPED